jgi:hypothetical protein
LFFSDFSLSANESLSRKANALFTTIYDTSKISECPKIIKNFANNNLPILKFLATKSPAEHRAKWIACLGHYLKQHRLPFPIQNTLLCEGIDTLLKCEHCTPGHIQQ